MSKMYLVTNRSASRVFYSVPEIGVMSRDFQPGETKKISFEELQGLNYQPGGHVLIKEYLFIQDPTATKEFIGHTEPEYNMTAADVKELILHGSMDEWLDCLDFAPEGVIDLVKELSIELPLTDTRKMSAFKDKTGTDLAKIIQIRQEEVAEEQTPQSDKPAQRRTSQESTPTAPEEPARRTSGSKYKVVKKG